jgi:hypothetical protein
MKNHGNSLYFKKIQEAIMRVFLKILKVLVIISVIFFGVTFTVYIFNLDMKLTAAIEPILLKHYDKIERDQHL